MVRDLDLLRLILSAAEQLPAGNSGGSLDPLEDMDDQLIGEHIQLLIDDNLIEGRVFRGMDSIHGYNVIRLTNRGHDFLQAARDESAWNKAKGAIASVGGAFTLDVLGEWLKAELRRRLGLP